MKTFVATIFLSLLSVAGAQDIASLMPQPTRSQSGQFLAYAVPGANGPVQHDYELSTNNDLVQLEPWLLVVSVERIKDVLWRELNVTTPATGKIFLFLYRAQSPDDPISITPQQFSDGWSYRVDLPDLINRDHFLSAMTHILVLELANRNADGRSAEIPLWLREGLARQLLSSHEADLIPRIPQWNVNGITISPLVTEGRRLDPLARAHDLLKATPALTFQELSWPSSDDLRGEPGEQFRSSAQLFVARLLGMRNGHDSFRFLIESLSQYYNWQLALLKAYHNQFSSSLDVEKWWAINVVQFTGHDLNQAWTEEESLRQLEETVRPPVEVRTATNQLPMHTDTTLQTIITDWKKSQRDDTLQQVINELAVLRFRLAPNIAAVADSYQNTLASYLKARDQFENIPEARRRSTVSESSLTRATLRTLNSLDAQCKALQPRPKRPSHTNASASLDTNGIKPIVP